MFIRFVGKVHTFNLVFVEFELPLTMKMSTRQMGIKDQHSGVSLGLEM